ncbi:hypothetical protein OESDEN_17378, partial [Oesophagostomum dentatum]
RKKSRLWKDRLSVFTITIIYLGGKSSTAVSQQLLVELRIAEREMDLLDPRTQASCLLRELRQVDKQIEQIEAARPVENC